VVLDLGCGNGIAAYAFADAGYEVLAADPDGSATVGLGAVAGLAAHPQEGRIAPLAAGAEALPLSGGAVHVVYARQALHHFRDLHRGLAECARVLCAGGVMLATREHVADDEPQLQAFLAGHPLHGLYGGENAFPLGAYLDAALRAGLTTLAVLGPYDSPLNLHPKTRAQARAEAVANLARKLGAPAAFVAMRVPQVLSAYLHRMSCYDRTPGRLYSFLFLKRGLAP
jgi:SAM-dependent methyltransferase